MSNIPVEIIEPMEMKGGRRFLVTLDGVKFVARVLLAQTNPSSRSHYRVLLYTITGVRLKNYKDPGWQQIRAEILKAIMKFRDQTGMSPVLARV